MQHPSHAERLLGIHAVRLYTSRTILLARAIRRFKSLIERRTKPKEKKKEEEERKTLGRIVVVVVVAAAACQPKDRNFRRWRHPLSLARSRGFFFSVFCIYAQRARKGRALCGYIFFVIRDRWFRPAFLRTGAKRNLLSGGSWIRVTIKGWLDTEDSFFLWWLMDFLVY